MPSFRYKAVNANGEVMQGSMDAGNVEEVIAHLHEQGCTPLSASPAGTAPGTGGLALFKRGPMSGDKLALFTHQLATLMGAGLPLDNALTMLQQLPEGAHAQALIERVRDRVRGGSTLSRALESEPDTFSQLYVSMVHAGEAGGALHATLLRLADYLERAQALRATVINALIYPAFLLVGVLGSLVLLVAYVVPQFVPIFGNMGVPLPWVTQAVLDLGQFVQAWWWAIMLVCAAATVFMHLRLKNPAARLAFHTRLLRVRVIGPLLLKVETARIARTLATLLGHGVSMMQALAVARKVTANQALGKALEEAADAVKSGSRLGAALERSELFPRLAVQMIEVGESAGELDTLLLKVADTFDDESRRAIDRMLAALVPVLTLVMTALVALIMAAILLPLLNLTSNIH